MVEEKELIQVNHAYLGAFTFVFMMAGSLQGGWVLAESGQVGYVLNEKLGWNSKEEDVMSMYTLVIVIGILGLAIGSVVGGTIGTKLGLRTTLLSTLALGAVFNGIKLVESTACILVGRFFFGFLNGITTFC